MRDFNRLAYEVAPTAWTIRGVVGFGWNDGWEDGFCLIETPRVVFWFSMHADYRSHGTSRLYQIHVVREPAQTRLRERIAALAEPNLADFDVLDGLFTEDDLIESPYVFASSDLSSIEGFWRLAPLIR